MSKLYPPSIEGKLPACAGESLIIPFTMNRAVGANEVCGMSAIIKTVSTGRTIATVSGQMSASTTGKYYANFNLSGVEKLTIGQFYKVQIAYKDTNSQNPTVGYYSTVGVFKRTAKPIVEVPQLKNNLNSSYEYTGYYSQDFEGGDPTEKVYSYCFEIKDTDGNLIDTSGVQIHDSSKDSLNTTESQDTWRTKVELPKDIPHYLTYTVTTMNNLETSSRLYTVVNQESVDIDLDIELAAELNNDDGSVKLSLQPKNGDNSSVSGNFVLVRASSENNFGSWEEVYRFSYYNTPLSRKNPTVIWEDYSVH